MSQIDIDKLTAIALAATPGPWEVFKGENGRARYYWDVVKPDAQGGERDIAEVLGPFDPVNAAHIAAFNPATVLALLSEVRALRLENAAMKQEIDAAWFNIARGWEIESREELEAASKTNGWEYALAQAVHHMWKRRVKEDAVPAAPLVSPPLNQVTATEAGVPCGRCGGPCLYETGLSNEQWNRVIRKGGPEQSGEYLCASCILRAFVLAGESFRAELSGGDVSGGAIEVRCVGLPVADPTALTDQDDACTSAAPLVSPPASIAETRQHHIWCNIQRGPVELCRMCSGPEGLHATYPQGDKSGVELMAQHFPNNVPRTAAEAPAETPGPECWCGRDEALARGDTSGARYDIVCPKHDGLFTTEPAPGSEPE